MCHACYTILFNFKLNPFFYFVCACFLWVSMPCLVSGSHKTNSWRLVFSLFPAGSQDQNSYPWAWQKAACPLSVLLSICADHENLCSAQVLPLKKKYFFLFYFSLFKAEFYCVAQAGFKFMIFLPVSQCWDSERALGPTQITRTTSSAVERVVGQLTHLFSF